ncbi:MAG: thioredoxin family protein [bacterium (Candidatus Stahlbacteria) CG23_combo_of_CG06-09_8_20_14_all_34_7]|nr:MAG: thioredoxin family protein [bacterium (Candidatus Stahlbacteria) CG23_combo_of_CG06-09_8_20_14_all_34_7]
MKIEILGTGCPKCIKLEENTKRALKDLQLEAEIIKVTNIKEIMKYKVMMTPALVVDGKVILSGRVLSPEGLKPLIKNNI